MLKTNDTRNWNGEKKKDYQLKTAESGQMIHETEQSVQIYWNRLDYLLELLTYKITSKVEEKIRHVIISLFTHISDR